MAPSVKTSVKFNNILELRKRLDRHEINQTLADVLEEVAEMWYEDAHEVTGYMKSRIQANPSVGAVGGQGGGLHGSVTCDAPYARVENDRGGLHEFTRRGITTGQRVLTNRIRALITGRG